MKKIVVVFSLTLPMWGGAFQVGNLASLGANDAVQWGTVNFSAVNFQTQFTVSSTGGIGVHASEATEDFALIQQAPVGSWGGDFPANAFIIDNQWGGPVTFTFSAPIQGFGVATDNAWNGLPAKAFITAYNGGNSLGTFEVDGTGLLFLGVGDSVAEITSVVITSNSQNGNGYFAFSDLNLKDSVTPSTVATAPEPGTIGLAIGGLGAMVVALRRRTG